MWTAKFKVLHRPCILAPLCKKYNIVDLVYLLNAWREKDYFYYSEMHIVQGTESNKKKFIQKLKVDKSIVKIRQNGNQMFTLNKVDGWKEVFMPLWDKRLIQSKPLIQKTDGTEIWEFSCWDKEPLMHILTKLPDEFVVELVKIEQTKNMDIYLRQVMPKMTDKQKEVINLALKKKYFEYPRKCNLDDLAKELKLSKQTVRQHLRVAENKLIHHITESTFS
jgi:predicted DNA binding protein